MRSVRRAESPMKSRVREWDGGAYKNAGGVGGGAAARGDRDGSRPGIGAGRKSRGRVIKNSSFVESGASPTGGKADVAESEVVSDDEGLGGCKFEIFLFLHYLLFILSVSPFWMG